MEEVMDLLNSILQKAMIINQGDYPQKIKDDAQRLSGNAIQFVIDETNTIRLNKLEMEEWKKNHAVHK